MQISLRVAPWCAEWQEKLSSRVYNLELRNGQLNYLPLFQGKFVHSPGGFVIQAFICKWNLPYSFGWID